MKKVGINGQWRNKLFFIVIHSFSIVKAAMNASHVCNCTKNVLPALTNAQWCYQKAEGLSEYGGQADFSKTVPHLSL
jgi:hypothetical protein